MEKINLIDVLKLIKENPYHWAQDKLYITTSQKIIIINNCSKENYNLIITKSEENINKQISLKKTLRKPIINREYWQEWEINLLKKYKNDYDTLKNMLPHRTIASIKTKCTRLFSKNNKKD